MTKEVTLKEFQDGMRPHLRMKILDIAWVRDPAGFKKRTGVTIRVFCDMLSEIIYDLDPGEEVEDED